MGQLPLWAGVYPGVSPRNRWVLLLGTKVLRTSALFQAKFAATDSMTASALTLNRRLPARSALVAIFALIQEHRPIQRIPLHRFEAGVADDAAQLFFGCAVRRSGGFDDVLF